MRWHLWYQWNYKMQYARIQSLCFQKTVFIQQVLTIKLYCSKESSNRKKLSFSVPHGLKSMTDEPLAQSLASNLWFKGSQSFSSQPTDLTVRLGQDVSLPCVVVNRRGVVQWTRDRLGLGVDRDMTRFSRYNMRGAGDQNDYSLKISGVTMEDDAK